MVDFLPDLEKTDRENNLFDHCRKDQDWRKTRVDGDCSTGGEWTAR